MLDRWFLQDILTGLEQAGRFVIIDEQRQCGALLEAVRKKLPGRLLEVNSEVEELQAKYQIEKYYRGEPVLIVAAIAPDKLKFLREYCETGGKLHIAHLHRYILRKVNEEMALDLGTRPAAEIRAIGLLSIGRKQDFWQRVKNGELFTVDDILSFLKNPPHAFKTLGAEGQCLFCDYLAQYAASPLRGKPAQTVADEFASALFDNLLDAERSPFFDRIYRAWLDSKSYEKALLRYLEKYSAPYGLDLWQVALDHPFVWIDARWRDEVLARLGDAAWLQEKLPLLWQRARQPVAQLLSISFCQDLAVLLSYDPSQAYGIAALDQAIEHYRAQFHKVDNAFRRLYTLWMAEKTLIAPLQEFYRALLQPFLDQWFRVLAAGYQEDQSGLLPRLLSECAAPTAIIVGDAIAYEIAEEIAQALEDECAVTRQVVCANYPSDTVNNMSSLFCGRGKLLPTREKRESALMESISQAVSILPDQEGGPRQITFMNLDDLSLSREAAGHTFLYSADVDQLSEKQQQNALKYYPEFIDAVRQKIRMLLNCGYQQVFLVSDHGFVLTGELSESDKIEFDVPDGQKYERFCLSRTRIQHLPAHVIEYEKTYKDAAYCYFSTTMHPFKTRGAYGFAHGGLTPQELLTPCFGFTPRAASVPELSVKIANKRALLSVVGDIYQIKIQAQGPEGELFAHERKVLIACVKGRQELSKSDIITIKTGETLVREFQFGQVPEFELMVLDARTQKRLDACPVKRQQARDLGGLL